MTTEISDCIAKMRTASDRFYAAAIHTGCHPFIEFTGFMNEYIKLAQHAADNGVDFRELSTHSGGALPIEVHEAAYIGEKLDCIFGPSFRANIEAYKAFKRQLEKPARGS